ncbi:hypothetical protein AB4Y85_16980 [Microvirga sp. 2YAF29]|uniref:hypothetical protein n=1 Tax=Microvirga sp. 2YAF29 TaxID=3233031 RepID=UPI003F9D0B9D
MTAPRASNHKKNHSFGGGIQLLACLGLAAGMTLAALPAEAAHNVGRDGKAIKAATEARTDVAVKDPETTGSVETSDDGLSCSQSRRRLFVEGEGWIVRKVTTCY